MNVTEFCIVILSMVAYSQAQIQIAGEQDGVYDGTTYLVTKDVIVPEGKNLEFLEGARILFTQYSGIKVYGQLKLKNSLLSASDSVQGSWNGIEVISDGTLCFDEVTVSRSILGIGVADSASLKCFRNVTFSSNKSSLRIADVPVFIHDGKPYTFEKSYEPSLQDHKDDISKIVNDANLPTERTSPVKPMRWISGVAAAVCAVVSTYCSIESASYHQAYDASDDNSDAQFNKSQSLKFRSLAIGTGIGAGVSGAVFIITFTIGSK